MKNRLKNALKLFYWAFKNPQTFQNHNFKMMSDLMILILKVADENRPYMSHIAFVHPETGEECKIVSIWAGATFDSDPVNRISELVSENQYLKRLLKKETIESENILP
jgi:hypothetical protein